MKAAAVPDCRGGALPVRARAIPTMCLPVVGLHSQNTDEREHRKHPGLYRIVPGGAAVPKTFWLDTVPELR